MRIDYFYFGIFVFVIGFLVGGYSAINLYNGSVISGLPYGIAIMGAAVCIIAFSFLSKKQNPKTTVASENQALNGKNA